MVTILPCKTKKELKLFERLPELLHQDNTYFVPPFPGSICKILNQNSPAQKHGRVCPYIAFKDGKSVGRIASIINRSHNEYYKDKTGFFGFFDFSDDVEVAKALLDKVQEDLKNASCDLMRGPYNPTVNDECGLLVEGFDSIPFVMMPYNPPYYIKIYETLGLVKARDLYAFYVQSSAAMPDKVKKVVARIKKSSGITIRNIEIKNLEEELKIIQILYNETLVRNWGFVPIEYEDLLFASKDLKAIIDPEMVMIAEKANVPIGFCLFIPNINELMWKAKKHKNSILRMLKFIWLLKTVKPKEIRLAVLGVRPEFQNTGIGGLFYFESFERGRNQWIGGEMSWVEESNEPMIRSISLFGGNRYKTYRIFEKKISL